MSKPKILIFIDWYYPAYKAGGPIRSVFSIINTLKSKYEFFIACGNKDLGNETLNVIPNVWHKNDDFQIIYFNSKSQSFKELLNTIKIIEPSIVYLNSLFSINFTIKILFLHFLKLFKAKVILAPRGMLGKGALSNKAYKKKIFLTVVNIIGLFKHVVFQATSNQEIKEIKEVLGQKKTILLARNLIQIPTINNIKSNKKEGKLNLVFYSRISRKKNLLFGLQALVGIENVNLSVYGPIEDSNYFTACENFAKNNNILYEYKGVIEPQQLPNTLIFYDYLFFPTEHENFGHVIAESLLNGLPCIISNQTYWNNIEQFNAGFVLPLEVKLWSEKLNFLINQDSNNHQIMKENARNLALKYANSEDLINETQNLFKS